MRIQIANAPDKDVKTLSLVSKENGSVSVTDGDSWDIITFSVQEGKLVFTRNGGIEDALIDTDIDGCVTEIPE